tara:strand:- start:45771 stop:47195 length:1425 start_codon:yes stop_codon:yes gene_type:complete
MSNRLFALAATALFASTASAQFCSDNTYPIHIVDVAGNELPVLFDTTINEPSFQVATEEVFLAFDPNLPTGTYYVHVTDTPIDGMDEVVSENDSMDRFVHVDNNAGVLTLSFPFSSDPSAITLGAGLNGAGQSMLLNPFRASQFSQCRFKAWYGDVWDLANGPENPYLLAGGINPLTGGCAVRSYHSFTVGDGSGSDLKGLVFNDANSNGSQEAGEEGLSGWQVNLVDGATTITATTDAAGEYCFENVGAGSFTVELVLQSGYTATTSSSNAIESCACANKAGGDFGVAQSSMNCNARTIGYWRNRHGRALVQQFNILPMLPALCIVNQCGQYVCPANICQYSTWLRRANSWNMAYMLSAQLVAMHNNVVVGYVDSNCVINDPCLGLLTIEQLMQQAVVSLCANPFTPSCSGPAREAQRKLKDALDRANNNLNWQSAPSSSTQTTTSGPSYSAPKRNRNRSHSRRGRGRSRRRN